jgi:iron complex outermembrane receptor protein
MGLRYDRVHYNFTNALPTGTKYKQQETTDFNIVAPKLGLTYDLGGNKGFYVNYSVGFPTAGNRRPVSGKAVNSFKASNL